MAISDKPPAQGPFRDTMTGAAIATAPGPAIDNRELISVEFLGAPTLNSALRPHRAAPSGG